MEKADLELLLELSEADNIADMLGDGEGDWADTDTLAKIGTTVYDSYMIDLESM